MSLFGLVWLGLNILAFLGPSKHLIRLLIVSCIFQSVSIIDNGGATTIMPILLTEVFILLKFLPLLLIKKRIYFSKNLQRFLVMIIVLIVTTLFASNLFQNIIKVYAPALGIDYNYRTGGVLLKFSSSNIVQIAYLVIHSLVIMCLTNNTSLTKNHNSGIAYHLHSLKIAIFLVVVIGFWEFSSKVTDLNFFPKEFFITSSNSRSEFTMNGLNRLNSTFLEPSFAGAFLAASFWAIFSISKTKLSYLFTLSIFVALVLNLSGTGIVSFILGGVIYFLANDLKKAIGISLIAISVIGILYFTPYFDIIYTLLTEKGDSHSGNVRFGAMYYSLDVFIQSYGLGVGLGSHRGAGFLTTLLASIGIIGLFFFSRFLIIIIESYVRFSKHNRSLNAVVYFAITLLIAQILAIPDLSYTPFWMWIFMAFTLDVYNENEKKIYFEI